VNGGWCLLLNAKNKTAGDYVKRGAPLGSNLFFAALAGAIWCSQFTCFRTGELPMRKTSYIGMVGADGRADLLQPVTSRETRRMERRKREDGATAGDRADAADCLRRSGGVCGLTGGVSIKEANPVFRPECGQIDYKRMKKWHLGGAASACSGRIKTQGFPT
jgi:hypothetical protein